MADEYVPWWVDAKHPVRADAPADAHPETPFVAHNAPHPETANIPEDRSRGWPPGWVVPPSGATDHMRIEAWKTYDGEIAAHEAEEPSRPLVYPEPRIANEQLRAEQWQPKDAKDEEPEAKDEPAHPVNPTAAMLALPSHPIAMDTHPAPPPPPAPHPAPVVTTSTGTSTSTETMP